MRTELKVIGLMIVLILVSTVTADTFTHKTDGTSFTGFATQKVTGGKTLVYNSEEAKMTPVFMTDYDVTYDTKGRRETVSLMQITEPEILLSQVVSKQAAAAIIDASNKGPQAIILQLDSPGGRGSYMKEIASAVSQTKNCPVIAFISGGPHGGAYSSAALIALACDKIYIHPSAGIGAVGPVPDGRGEQSYGRHLAMYNSSTLVTYATYAGTLAMEHRRPELLAQALIDKTLSIAEVANKDGSREFISLKDRQATQTLIRTLCEGMVPSVASDLPNASPVDVVGKVLNLTSQDAVEVGLVDSTADSIRAVLADMNMADVKLTPIGRLDKMLKKYAAARRNIAESLSRIDQIEKQVDMLNEQFTEIDNQLRLGMQTREYVEGASGNTVYRSSRGKNRSPANYGYYYGDNGNNSDVYRRDSNTSSRRTVGDPIESVSRQEPTVDIQTVYQRLTNELQTLVNEYRRVLGFVKRWPGGLAPELSEATLREDMKSASDELDNLYQYQPVYPLQRQETPTRIGDRSPRTRNRY